MKHEYVVDLINRHNNFLGKYDLDLISVYAKNVDFQYTVLVRDPVGQGIAFARNFSNFRMARAFYSQCLSNELSIVEISDLYTLAKEFYNTQQGA